MRHRFNRQTFPVNCLTGLQKSTMKQWLPVKAVDPLGILDNLAFPGSDFSLVTQTMDFSLLPAIMQHIQKSCQDMDLFVYGDLHSSLSLENIPVLIVLAAPKGKQPLDVAFLKEADGPAKKVSYESVGWNWEQHRDSFCFLTVQKLHDVDWEKGQCAKPWTSYQERSYCPIGMPNCLLCSSRP